VKPTLPDLGVMRTEAKKCITQYQGGLFDFQCEHPSESDSKEHWQHSLDCPHALPPEMSGPCPFEEVDAARRNLEGLDLISLLPQCFLNPEAAAGQRILDGLVSQSMLQSYR
jgi:hypothetical protein